MSVYSRHKTCADMSCVICAKKAGHQCVNQCGIKYCGDKCANVHWNKHGHGLICAGIKRDRPDTIIVVSGDGVEVEVTAEEAKGSDVLVNLIEDARVDAEGNIRVVLENVMSVELEHIISYLKEGLFTSDISLSDLIRVTNAANYLGISPLLELASTRIVAFLFGGLRYGVETITILERAGIRSEFSDDERRQLSAETDEPFHLSTIRDVALELPSRNINEPTRITQLHKDFFINFILPTIRWERLKLFRLVNIRIYKVVTTYMLVKLRAWLPNSEDFTDQQLMEIGMEFSPTVFNGETISQASAKKGYGLSDPQLKKLTRAPSSGTRVGYFLRDVLSLVIRTFGSFYAARQRGRERAAAEGEKKNARKEANRATDKEKREAEQARLEETWRREREERNRAYEIEKAEKEAKVARFKENKRALKKLILSRGYRRVHIAREPNAWANGRTPAETAVEAWLNGPLNDITEEHPMFAQYLLDMQTWIDDAILIENMSGLWSMLTGDKFLQIVQDVVAKQKQ